MPQALNERAKATPAQQGSLANHHAGTLVLGLTGAMAAGKSTLAAWFKARHVPVFDADATVRALRTPGQPGALGVARILPAVMAPGGGVDMALLRAHLKAHPEMLPQLEGIFHPLVAQARRRFIKRCVGQGAKLCVLDIPLLWETGADKDCDGVMVADAPLDVRLARLAQRAAQGGMAVDQARALMARQTSPAEARARANWVVDTGGSVAHAGSQLEAFMNGLCN
ncbi:dephospho-CoA kinase [Formicincola oecophyllae]|uniref:Dephospho-CoA kinase n=1 Tax=Formicincola oecophyllae TaxID=2558361 RepID=A0A4Y6U964_9PROT|nr:dephospho-CoA kinase [Formicincola oecophyllae]QDH12921.1 dephospho-CoA kinase [Formicincola oecophyllae]